jgi:hypothetical protein
MQKLVVIEMTASSSSSIPKLVEPLSGQHRGAPDPLKDLLEKGWRITSITSAGSGNGQLLAAWFAVVLEKPDADSA